MKFTTSVISGLALCVANVAAQDFGSLPTCAQACATNAIPASCGLDVECICSTSSFITSVSCCVATACDSADQQTTLQFAEQLCAGAGVTTLPSAAGCSATSAATSAASSGTSTSKASAASTAVTSAKTSASAISSSAGSSTGSSATTSATGTASSSASSTSHSGAATPLAKGNGVAVAGAGAAALLAAIFV